MPPRVPVSKRSASSPNVCARPPVRRPRLQVVRTSSGAAPGTHHPSPITHHPSPITHHPSPITHHPSPITHHPSPITHLSERPSIPRGGRPLFTYAPPVVIVRESRPAFPRVVRFRQALVPDSPTSGYSASSDPCALPPARCLARRPLARAVTERSVPPATDGGRVAKAP